MTPDCNYDTAPHNVGAEDNAIDYFEIYSDCW